MTKDRWGYCTILEMVTLHYGLPSGYVGNPSGFSASTFWGVEYWRVNPYVY